MSDMAENNKESEPVLVEREGPVCILSINRPAAGNAISMAVRHALIRTLDDIAGDPNIRVVVLEGEGDEAFSVGLDLPELASLTTLEMRHLHELSATMYRRLTRLNKPIIAAVHGGCIGAGFELALHCDIRFARADARFGLPAVGAGIVSNGLALSRLAMLIGHGPAQAMALTGGIISAERAFALGIVTNVLKPGDFTSAVHELATHFAQLSPTAVAETKRAMRESAEGGAEAAYKAAQDGFVRCFEGGDAGTRLRGFFGGPSPDVQLH
jgi:enoyl-CoA hydratase